MDYKGMLSDLELIDLKCSLAAIEGRVGVVINLQEFIGFVRELASFKKEILSRING